jgi:hypothetical protein
MVAHLFYEKRPESALKEKKGVGEGKSPLKLTKTTYTKC